MEARSFSLLLRASVVNTFKVFFYFSSFITDA
jgi:hypothetical protein